MVHRSLYNIVTVVVLLMSYSIPNGAQGYNISGVVNSHSIKGERLIITVSLRNRSDISLPFNKEKDIVVLVDSTGHYCFKNVLPGNYVLLFYSFPELERRFAQEVTDKDEVLDIELYEDGRDLPEQARRDLEIGCPRLYVLGGIDPKSFIADSLFEEQYGIIFKIEGCIIEDGSDYYPHYNRVIFDYLTEKYGRSWRTLIRKDVEGYKGYSYKKHKRNSLDKSHR